MSITPIGDSSAIAAVSPDVLHSTGVRVSASSSKIESTATTTVDASSAQSYISQTLTELEQEAAAGDLKAQQELDRRDLTNGSSSNTNSNSGSPSPDVTADDHTDLVA